MNQESNKEPLVFQVSMKTITSSDSGAGIAYNPSLEVSCDNPILLT